jgi:hypothetical protein
LGQLEKEDSLVHQGSLDQLELEVTLDRQDYQVA